VVQTILDVTSGATEPASPDRWISRHVFYTLLNEPGYGAAATGNVSATPVPVGGE